MQGLPLSERGKTNLTNELNTLKNEKMPEVLEAIAEYRALGDLSENAPYHAAREELAMIEARVSDIENILARGFIVDINRLPKDRIVFGTKVVVANLETKKDETYHLIGEGETNPDKGWILTTSPLGQALMGKKEGEELTAEIPAGEVPYKVKSISFID